MKEFLTTDREIFTASASGRIDVMGGIADYSGSILLQMPIAETTTVKLQKRNDRKFRLRTIDAEGKERHCEWNWSLSTNTSLIEAGLSIKNDTGAEWPVYIIGCFILLNKRKGLEITGADILISTQIPQGKGVSSSAAIEVATIKTISIAWNLWLDSMELPMLAQSVENEIVGAACGLMDQLSVCYGEKNHLLPLVCQPAEVYAPVEIPEGIHFTGIDSGVRHAVGGSDYRTVRTAAFMAYSVIANREGISENELQAARLSGDWTRLPYKGYLANIPVSKFEQHYTSIVPEEIIGADFIGQFGTTQDKTTEVEPERIYRLRAAARHPVYENHRIQIFLNILMSIKSQPKPEPALSLLGELMMQSHSGYSSIGLGNERTDEIVEMVRSSGSGKQVYGARISGGGSGGTVVVLGYGVEGFSTVQEIYHKCQNKYGRNLYFFSGNK